jgi:hypothetical protein
VSNLSKDENKHPWLILLEARAKVILWMKNHHGKSDFEIARDLSMDEKQFFLIRSYEEKVSNLSNENLNKKIDSNYDGCDYV